MLLDMIKPYQITHVRKDVDGQTIFFKVSKTVPKGTGFATLTMDSALFVSDGEDIDGIMDNYLKDSGWML